VDDAGDGEEKERTSATGLGLKRARRSLLAIVQMGQKVDLSVVI